MLSVLMNLGFAGSGSGGAVVAQVSLMMMGVGVLRLLALV